MKATEQIIIDAINGGFMKQDGMVFVISNKEMFYVDQENPPNGAGYCRTIKLTTNEEKYLLMPNFWRDVGKTRGWKNAKLKLQDGIWKPSELKSVVLILLDRNSTEYHMHSFMGHLADGLTIEEALTKISRI